MHKLLLNDCRLTATLSTRSPLLVRSAVETISGPEVGVVLTVRDGMDQPYLPGSTLKGALRSQAGRIARTLRPDSGCNPVDERGPLRFCGRRLEERERESGRGERQPVGTAMAYYRDSCALCKIFGNTFLASRLFVGDGYLQPDVVPALVRRDGVGIDRFSGSASLRSRYELEAVADVTFDLQLRLTNFEVWQLGLITLALRDLLDGQLPLGSGKSHGLGQVAGALMSVEVSYGRGAGGPDQQAAILGVGALSPDGRSYGYRSNDVLALEGATAENDGWRRVQRIEPDRLPVDALTDHLVTYLEQQYRPSPWLSRDGDDERSDAARVRHADR